MRCILSEPDFINYGTEKYISLKCRRAMKIDKNKLEDIKMFHQHEVNMFISDRLALAEKKLCDKLFWKIQPYTDVAIYQSTPPMETILARVNQGYNTIAKNPWLRLFARSCPKVEGTHPKDFNLNNEHVKFSSRDLKQSGKVTVRIRRKEASQVDES